MSPQTRSVDSSSRDERRRAILRAAITVFARKGYHGCRISDVAKEAGVAYGLVYHYFKNKDELLQTVFDLGWSGFISRVRAVAEGEGALREKVRRIADVALEAYRVDPRAVKVIILEVARSPAVTRVDRNGVYFDTLRMAEAMFTRAQEAGELRGDLTPQVAAALLLGALEMGLTACVAGLINARDPQAFAQAKAQIATIMLHGVLSDSAPAQEAPSQPARAQAAVAPAPESSSTTNAEAPARQKAPPAAEPGPAPARSRSRTRRPPSS